MIFRGNDTDNFNSRLNDEDFAILCDAFLEFSNSIEHIDLSYNKISDLTPLVSLIRNCEGLRTLNL